MLEFNPGIISGRLPERVRRMKWFLNFSPSLTSCEVSGIAVPLFALLAVKPGEVVNCLVQKKVHNPTAEPNAAKIG